MFSVGLAEPVHELVFASALKIFMISILKLVLRFLRGRLYVAFCRFSRDKIRFVLDGSHPDMLNPFFFLRVLVQIGGVSFP